MQLQQQYDVAIVGGGLSGLSCAIQLGRQGRSVILFEKETYPFHKVCGEYVSLESWNFLQHLGLPLEDMGLPAIDTLFLTAPDGTSFTTALPLGGFGISRYKLDNELARLARENGVLVFEETKVEQVAYNNGFEIHFTSRRTDQKSVKAGVCCAAFGKRSNLDIKWKRSFLDGHDKRLDNYVAVKYHLRTKGKENVIGLHNFKNGYCGISKVEEDKYCLCYMVRSESLKRCNNDIAQLEKTVVNKNPHLSAIFSKAEIIGSFPVTISQIHFQEKRQIENHVLMLGDAAGMITPLCGNGMSIALHTGKIAALLISRFLNGTIDRKQMEEQYERQWRFNFARRLQAGRALQKFFGNERLSNFFVRLFKAVPFLAGPVIKMTHGKPF
jgi:menaquinone-9 beta-reductase